MITKFLIFDFATRFYYQNPTITEPEIFEIDDDIYRQFAAFVQERNFGYESQSEQLLKELIEQAKEEKYYDLASGEFEQIKAKLEPQLDKDLHVFSEEIRSLLKNEIVSRYYFQKGAIRSSLGQDKLIRKAIDELSSPLSYNSYFEPGTVITMARP